MLFALQKYNLVSPSYVLYPACLTSTSPHARHISINLYRIFIVEASCAYLLFTRWGWWTDAE